MLLPSGSAYICRRRRGELVGIARSVGGLRSPQERALGPQNARAIGSPVMADAHSGVVLRTGTTNAVAGMLMHRCADAAVTKIRWPPGTCSVPLRGREQRCCRAGRSSQPGSQHGKLRLTPRRRAVQGVVERDLARSRLIPESLRLRLRPRKLIDGRRRQLTDGHRPTAYRRRHRILAASSYRQRVLSQNLSKVESLHWLWGSTPSKRKRQ